VGSTPYIPDSSVELLLPTSFPPMFDMGERFEECEGDPFPVKKMVNREITVYQI
jgi:hypothetical protein